MADQFTGTDNFGADKKRPEDEKPEMEVQSETLGEPIESSFLPESEADQEAPEPTEDATQE